MNKPAQHAALKALRAGIDEEITATQADVLRMSKETGADRWKTAFGIVGVVERGPSVYVTSDKAFLAWVREHAPAEVVESVRDSYRKALFERLEIDGDQVVDTTTGEVVPWAGVRQGGGAYLSVREAKAAKERIAELVHERVEEIAALAAPRVLEGGET